MAKYEKGTKSYITYRLEVPVDLWNNFKAFLRKVYWKEEMNIDEGIIKLMKEFIEKNDNSK